MPIAIALVVGVVVLAIFLIGLIWSFLFLVPFYAFVGATGLLIWLGRRKDADIAASVERETEKQRLFNEQETRAWQASLQKQQSTEATLEKALCRSDSARDGPEK